MSRIVFVGEGMLELSRDGEAWRLGHGGDTLNTAIHMARAGHEVGFLTALGSDPFSAGLKGAWTAEGLDPDLILAHPTRPVGLYAITNDPSGERSFTYWRDGSAARAVFELPESEAAAQRAARARLLAFSLISLAILPPSGRDRLLEVARQVRASGGDVAFDGNYRPRLWADPAEARRARDAAIACATIGLPTLEDEKLLGGVEDADEAAAHWRSIGCEECVVKLGADGCRLPDGEIVPPLSVLEPVDTSGAGDAFNAGYLGARLRGEPPGFAAVEGHALAGWTIMRPGAIPTRDS